MKTTHQIFVYGTLKEPRVQRKLLGRVLRARTDVLPGFARNTLEINANTYYVADPDAAASIEGKLLTGISDYELVLLDDYETQAYRRVLVTLLSGKRAWVYCRA